MVRFVLRRLAVAAVLLVGLLTLVFGVLHALPGDPADRFLDPDADPEAVLHARRALGLDAPLPVQYARWLQAFFLQRDLGQSFATHRPVAAMLREAVPNTILLAGTALAVRLLLGIALGTWAAVRRGRAPDRAVLLAALVLHSIPAFWLGAMAMLLFVFGLGWFPPSGMQSLDHEHLSAGARVTDTLHHLVLPVLVLAAGGIASTARYVRASVITAMAHESVRTARARGLPERRIVLHHALREAVTILEDNDTFRFLRLCRAALAGVTALAGDAAGAGTWMAAADGQAGGSNRLFGPWVERWRAWTAYAAGATGEAVAAATRAAELGTMAALPTVEAAARYDIARLGAPTDLRRLDELAGSAGTPLAAAIAGAARALSTMDGEGLARAGTAFGALGQHLLAAEAVTAAACAYRRAGQRGTAALYRERAAALRARCRLARTPLLAPDDATAVLTPREREVVLLALRLSSKQIAGNLGLSLHTVNNNLARAYAKLGVSGRGELRALLADG